MSGVLDDLLPVFDVRSQHSIRVQAPRDRVWPAVSRLDARGSWVIRVLFALRGLPRTSLNRDGLLALGFTLVHEQPPTDLVLGVIGQPWRLDGGLVRTTAAEFRAWDRPPCIKVAWGFALHEDGGETRVATETRIRAFDDRTRRLFRAYWTVIGPFSGIVRRALLQQIRAAAEAP